jgi:hypothetical protein
MTEDGRQQKQPRCLHVKDQTGTCNEVGGDEFSKALGMRLKGCVISAWQSAFKTSLWLLSVTIPVSFGVLLLKVTGLMDIVASFFEPVFSLFGLPGESALVFVTACLLNIYACIVVIETLDLPTQTVTILALMCLISHNLPVEGAVQKKTGSCAIPITLVRLACSFVAALVLQRLLPSDATSATTGTAEALATTHFATELKLWFISTSVLCVKIIALITLLMILQRLLEEFGITTVLAQIMKYPLMLLGIPHQAAFLWIVANTLGLAYGAGVMIDHVQRGRLSRKNADLLNYHIAVSHSLLEDTCLFVAIGVSAWWITLPRIALAGMVVWLKRLLDWIKGRGTTDLTD